MRLWQITYVGWIIFYFTCWQQVTDWWLPGSYVNMFLLAVLTSLFFSPPPVETELGAHRPTGQGAVQPRRHHFPHHRSFWDTARAVKLRWRPPVRPPTCTDKCLPPLLTGPLVRWREKNRRRRTRAAYVEEKGRKRKRAAWHFYMRRHGSQVSAGCLRGGSWRGLSRE